MVERQASGLSSTDFSEPGVARDGSLLGTVMNWVGALTSIALVAGLAIWGYKLTIRDVSGVPVVRAIEGPMRVQPEDPGGRQAAHQGLAVNAVQAEGSAAAPADRLVLAPKPVDIDENLPLARVLEDPASDATPSAEGADLELAEVEDARETEVALSEQAEELSDDPVAAALALAERLSRDAEPLEPLEEVADAPEVVVSLDTVSPSVPGVARSPRPRGRPSQEVVARAAAEAVTIAAAASTSTIDVDPDQIAPGTRLVQLGAFDSSEVAISEWRRLSGRFGAYMEDKKRVIQKAKSGGRTFYRLRAMGFGDINDARRFCSALQAENAACIPVVTR